MQDRHYCYIVEIGYRKFRFFDDEEAMHFARLAYETAIDPNETVEIYLESIDKEDN